MARVYTGCRCHDDAMQKMPVRAELPSTSHVRSHALPQAAGFLRHVAVHGRVQPLHLRRSPAIAVCSIWIRLCCGACRGAHSKVGRQCCGHQLAIAVVCAGLMLPAGRLRNTMSPSVVLRERLAWMRVWRGCGRPCRSASRVRHCARCIDSACAARPCSTCRCCRSLAPPFALDRELCKLFWAHGALPDTLRNRAL